MNQAQCRKPEPVRYQSNLACAPRDGDHLELSIFTEVEQVRQISDRCTALLEQPLEQNVFYEPWMLLAFAGLQPDRMHVVVIGEPGGIVTGIFPFELQDRFRGLPLRVLKFWQHRYCFLCTPLILAGRARQTLRCLFDWLESKQAPASMIELELYSAEGPFDALLQAELAERPHWCSRSHRYERAVFRPAQVAMAGISGRHLKELRRRARRLGEIGARVYREFTPGEDVDPWLSRLLDLEASGWKGRERTALASNPMDRDCFECIVRAAAAQGRLQMLSLELDGTPIAMMCSFLSGEISFGFKMAYDERYAKYSPGVLLQLFNMQSIRQRSPQTQCIDSCSVAEDPLMSRLWTQRRAIGGTCMTSRSIPAALIHNWQHLARIRKFFFASRQAPHADALDASS